MVSTNAARSCSLMSQPLADSVKDTADTPKRSSCAATLLCGGRLIQPLRGMIDAMPELPEVETIVRGLRPVICGRRLGRTILTRPDVVKTGGDRLPTALAGRRVRELRRRGKRLALHLDNDTILVFALGMTGTITINHVADTLLPHTHIRIRFGNARREIRFRDPRRFGGVWLLNGSTATKDHPLARLGEEPLEINVRQFRRLLNRKRQIKAFLLDQHVIAGLGNIYCDEALHRASIHPLTRAIDLSPEQAGTLLRNIRSVLRAAIEAGGSTLMDYRNAQGQPGRFQQRHRVYNRQGKPCRRCKTPIIRLIVAGRSTHICPACQRLEG